MSHKIDSRGFCTVEEALEELKQGRMIVVVDDEDRENEGDLVMPAETANAEAINFMATHGRGLICMPVEEARLRELGMEPMVVQNTDLHQTAFTVSIDHLCTTTGISAHERADTIKGVLDPEAKATDFRRPGHVFPLAARPGGVLKRTGHTEASVDLARMAGFKPAAVICEIMNDNGTMARMPELRLYCAKHDLKLLTIKELVRYRKRSELQVERISEADMPTKSGHFRILGYQDKITGEHHVALVKGDFANAQGGQNALASSLLPLVRIHSECLTGDAFGSLRCDCGEQLHEAMAKIEAAGAGALIYLRQEGRGIGMLNKIKAYDLQDKGFDTVDANTELGFGADDRDYAVGAQILKELGYSQIKLMTNNPEKVQGLEDYGIEVVQREEIRMNHNEVNAHYLQTKKDKMGHML